MKSASAALIAILNTTTKYLFADLYTITLFNGTVLRWTDVDTNIVYGGHTFLCATERGTAVPVISRSRVKWSTGLEVDTLDLTLGTAGTVLIGGTNLNLAAAGGLFDSATVLVERAFMSTWGDTTPGTLTVFSGFVASVVPSSTHTVLNVKSDLEQLAVAVPRNTFSPACGHVVYDTGCTLSRAAFLVHGIVAGSPTTKAFDSNLTQADTYFQLGVLTFTSGILNGVSASVKTFVHASGHLVLTATLQVAPSAGDTFDIVPGCDKTQATCTAKFANLQNFRGFPFIPKNESTRGIGGG